MSFLKNVIRKIYYKRYIRIKIIDYYSKKDNISDQEREVLEFLRHNSCHTYPYEFTKKYSSRNIKVYRDGSSGMKYVVSDGKKLFMKSGWSDSAIKRGLKNLLLEQDSLSPHRYLTDTFDVSPDDVVADIGCADGNFGLMVIDRIKHLYLFEVDPLWISALQKTFEPWRDKVTIVNKMVSDRNDEQNISIDEFVREHPITFIKGDLEGYEEIVLSGASALLSSDTPLKVVITTYHTQGHGHTLHDTLVGAGFRCRYSRGYMILKNQGNLKPPYLRRGLIYAEKP